MCDTHRWRRELVSSPGRSRFFATERQAMLVERTRCHLTLEFMLENILKLGIGWTFAGQDGTIIRSPSIRMVYRRMSCWD